MKSFTRTKLAGSMQLLAALVFGLLFQPMLHADVVVLQNGTVITGNILQQDANGILVQGEYGTFRYPQSLIKDARKEPAAARHVSNNGQAIPDWAQIVTLLADSGFAPEIKQVPATVITYGNFKNVPYVSFRCAYGGYEINVYGDLNQPAAVQIGAMGYLKDSAAAKSNCVNFICSVLANAEARKMVRALNWGHKDLQTNGGLTLETLLPGEWGSYGGWWVSVSDRTALAAAQASEAELLALTQNPPPAPSAAGASQPAFGSTNLAPDAAAQPPAAAAQPLTTTTTTYGTDGYYGYGWTAGELAAAHPATAAATTAPATAPASTDPGLYHPAYSGGMYYPRTYTRTAGTYGAYRR